jgi:hypothetical protein
MEGRPSRKARPRRRPAPLELTDFCRCLRSCCTASIWRFFSAARSLFFWIWTCFAYAFCSRALRLGREAGAEAGGREVSGSHVQ